jgi:hypothetical protein
VDYSGDTFWMIQNDTLYMDITGDLTGRSYVSLKTGQGKFAGRFRAPLGDNSFTLVGEINWKGIIEKKGSAYSMLLRIEIGTDDFENVTGYIESDWLQEADRFYHAGTFCGNFP